MAKSGGVWSSPGAMGLSNKDSISISVNGQLCDLRQAS